MTKSIDDIAGTPTQNLPDTEPRTNALPCTGASSAAGGGIRHCGIGHDARTGEHFHVLAFHDISGAPRELLLSFQEKAEGERKALQRLAEMGYPVPAGRDGRLEIVKAIDQAPGPARFSVASQTGWSGTRFCTPLGVHAIEPNNVRTNFSNTWVAYYAVAGTLEEWKVHVAEPARGNAILIFGLALAFAPPLMRDLNAESGGFQLVGGSSTGKTTTAYVAGSVWGGGGPLGYAQNWSSTINALERMAITHSDTLLVLDETGLAADDKGQKGLHKIPDAAYRLSSGGERARLTDTGPRGTWRVMFLSTSEHSLVDLAQRAGVPWSKGQLVRSIDVRADGGKGMGVFGKLHGSADAGAFAERMNAAATTYYGVAARAFLDRLVAEQSLRPEELQRWLKKRMRYYRRRTKEVGEGGPLGRVAKRFALVYAAGALASEYGILPFTRKELFRAVRHCHRQAILEPLRQAGEPRSSVEIVAKYIRSRQDEFVDLQGRERLSEKALNKAPGLVRTRRSGEKEYVFTSDTFRTRVCAGGTWRDVVRELRAAGFMRQGKQRRIVELVHLPEPAGRKWVVCINSRILDVKRSS